MDSRFDLRVMILDPALRTTGFAIYGIDTFKKFEFRLAEFGFLETQTHEDRHTRIRHLIQPIIDLRLKHELNAFILEEPGASIYGSKFLSKNAIVGRASSVQSVIAACYGIAGWCEGVGIYCRTLLPVQWQLGKPKRAKLNSKVWSVREANKVLEYLKIKGRKLSTTKDENTADAINIGIHAITQWTTRKWECPSFAAIHRMSGISHESTSAEHLRI